MAIPIIDTTTSIQGHRQGEAWRYLPGTTNSPVPFAWTWSGLPPGVAVDVPEDHAATGASATDIITSAAHGFQNGAQVIFTSLTGGTGFAVNTAYHVRDVTTDTFKLAATAGGAAVNFTSDITAAVITELPAGAIYGPATEPGVYLARVTATNSYGTSDPVTIPIAIFGRTWGEDGALPVNIDVRTGIVYPVGLPAWKAGDPVAFGKSGDWLLLDVGFTSDGGASLIPLGPVQLTFGVKQYEPDDLIAISDGEFTTIGEWDATRYRILCHLDRSNAALMSALSDNEGDADTQFDARCELTWTQQIADGTGGTLLITRSSRTFTLRLAREFIQ